MMNVRKTINEGFFLNKLILAMSIFHYHYYQRSVEIAKKRGCVWGEFGLIERMMRGSFNRKVQYEHIFLLNKGEGIFVEYFIARFPIYKEFLDIKFFSYLKIRWGNFQNKKTLNKSFKGENYFFNKSPNIIAMGRFGLLSW